MKMPRLIDESKAKEVFTDYYHIHTSIQRIALEEAFSRVPTVEAIAVEWLQKKRDEWKDKGMFGLACCVELLIEVWREENGKAD